MIQVTHPYGVSHEGHARTGDLVSRLQNSEIFRQYQAAFEVATGLPLVLRAIGSFQAPLYGSKRLNSFCALMASTSKSCAACLQLQQRIDTEALGTSKTFQCFAGLSESVVPVRNGEKIVAYLQTGQVMLQSPTERRFKAALQELAKRGTELDLTLVRASYFKSRVVTKAHYESTVRLLSSFAQHLSLISNELMTTQATAEPPAVARARAFIAENLSEVLSLSLVARAANMSAFYFCKIFKAATGLTFTDYLARVRVEKTKQLLLNPHVRISEAGFAAGFQSLSQFNRVFRRVAGESPSGYREHLPSSTGAATARLAFAA